MDKIDKILKKFEDDWKSDGYYSDVKAIEWSPGQEREKCCPEGCQLNLWESDCKYGWRRVVNRDAYRHTRFCRNHKYARIYYISGSAEQNSKVRFEDDKDSGWDGLVKPNQKREGFPSSFPLPLHSG